MGGRPGDEAVVRVTGQPVAIPERASARRFNLENGAALLHSAFAAVERRDAAGELVVPEPGPIVDYVASLTTLRAALAAGTWAAVLAEIERLAAAEIAARGAVRIATHAGLFICT